MQRETVRQAPQKKNGPHTDPFNSQPFSGDFRIRMNTSILLNSLGLLRILRTASLTLCSKQPSMTSCNLLMLGSAGLPCVLERPAATHLAAGCGHWNQLADAAIRMSVRDIFC